MTMWSKSNESTFAMNWVRWVKWVKWVKVGESIWRFVMQRIEWQWKGVNAAACQHVTGVGLLWEEWTFHRNTQMDRSSGTRCAIMSISDWLFSWCLFVDLISRSLTWAFIDERVWHDAKSEWCSSNSNYGWMIWHVFPMQLDARRIENKEERKRARMNDAVCNKHKMIESHRKC